jgi:hypothetical protein
MKSVLVAFVTIVAIAGMFVAVAWGINEANAPTCAVSVEMVRHTRAYEHAEYKLKANTRAAMRAGRTDVALNGARVGKAQLDSMIVAHGRRLQQAEEVDSLLGCNTANE